VSGHVVQAQSIRDIHFHHHEETPVPSQVPPPPRSFASRQHDLDALTRWLADNHDGTRIVVLSGTAGVGKTALALRWLPELREDYVDGLLFVDLGRASADPVMPSEALEWFLLSLGVAAKNVPVETTQREAMYRTVTARRRLVVFLDNAVSATQVRPLLPASNHSIVVVTSRFRLSGLVVDGAHWVAVDPLDVPGSVQVLQQILGKDRVRAELDAAHELAVLCGGLPLALAIVAARLATRPRRRLAHEVTNLRVEQRRLSGLSLDGDMSVKAVFDLSYAELTHDAVRLYRLCALHPGPDFGVEVAAAALHWSSERAEAVLDSLLEASFLLEVDDRRFGYHDLLRLYARQRADDEDTPETRESALNRMVRWYLNQAVAADLAVHPLRPRLGPRYGEIQRQASPFVDAQEALSWLESHRVNLREAVDIAAQRQWHELVWQLCEALWGFFLHTRHYGDWIRMHQLGIMATQRCGSRRAEARLRSQLGFAYAKLHRYDESVVENTTALRLAEAEQDSQAQATALSQLGRTARESGDLLAALEYFRQARECQQEIGQWRGVALCRRRIGQILSTLERHEEAATELAAAADTMRQLGDNTQYARTLLFLADSYVLTGQIDRAGSLLHQALSLMRTLGSPYYQAEALSRLGDVMQRQGHHESARASYQEAAELYTDMGDPTAEVMLARLTELAEPQQP
jgi:tetratricopeptide (TPR) repeat protein